MGAYSVLGVAPIVSIHSQAIAAIKEEVTDSMMFAGYFSERYFCFIMTPYGPCRRGKCNMVIW